MSEQPGTRPDRFRKAFLLLLVVGISAIFFAMIRGLLASLLLAAVLSAIAQPLYRRLLRLLRGRTRTASLLTVLAIFLVLVVPLSGLAGLIVAQAIQVSQSLSPTIQKLIEQPNYLDRFFERVPLLEQLRPYQDLIFEKAGELATWLGGFIINSVGAITRGTASFVFRLFVMLYASFFFLKDGSVILDRILYYTPLPPNDADRLLDKFISVSRATLKGNFVIALVQGALGGLAFAFFGIGGAVFWGAIMAVSSLVPGIGSALVWIPAVIYLIAIGRFGAGLGLAAWCALVVGSVDNVLRPRLVGRDVEMSDLLVLLGTLGGLALFGVLGIVIGPIVAALFITVWDIYGEVFKEYLPGKRPRADEEPTPEPKKEPEKEKEEQSDT